MLSPNRFRKRVWGPAVEASVGQPAKPHDLRHTFVSLLIHEGASVERVCEQARHANPTFTWQRYKKQFEERSKDMEEAMRALQDVRSAAQGKAQTDRRRTKDESAVLPMGQKALN